MAAMLIAVAVTGGAALTSAGSGALQETLRMLGFGREAAMAAEQRKQAATIAQLEEVIHSVGAEVLALSAQANSARARESAATTRLVALDREVATMKSEMRAMRVAAGDIAQLRSSLDAAEQTQRRSVADINRRLDRVEQEIGIRDRSDAVSQERTRPRAALSGPPRAASEPPLGPETSGAAKLRGHVLDLPRTGH